MKNMLRKIYIFFVLLVITGIAGTDLSVYAQRAYRVSDRQVSMLLRQIEADASSFTSNLDSALDRSGWNGTRTENEINGYVRDFKNATQRLSDRFDSRTSVSADVEEVLTRAAFIDRFLSQYRLSGTVSSDWNRVRADLNQLANFYNVSWDWNRSSYPTVNTGGMMPYRVTDRQVSNILSQLESSANNFKNSLNSSLDRSSWNGTRTEDEINGYVRDFKNATDRLKSRFDSRQSVAADVEDVLNRAAFIDNFLRNYRQTARAERDWNQVRNNLSTLAGYYNVTWNWSGYTLPTNTGTYDNGRYNSRLNRLNGTYRLDVTRSANVEAEIDRVLSDLPSNQRDRVRRNALRRLQSPEYLAIERNGNIVTLASSMSPRLTLDASGRTVTETLPNGRSMSVNASIRGDQLVINYTGDRMNDYYVAFNPTRNGDELRVTRRVYFEGVNRQVSVDSIYTRTSQVAQFDEIYRGNQTVGGINNTTTTTDDFVVPNGTRIVAVLNSDLDTKTNQVGDRFTMEVRSPSEYSGAIIEGRVSSVERSGRITGRARLGLDFDTIRLRNGQTYRFAGLVDQITTADNQSVSITNEGVAADKSSQTSRTVTRTALGAALGALIGAIAGGGEGAAIGAGVGAGVGAGSVILQGRDDLTLRSGTEIVISASAPRGVASYR